MKYSTSNEGGTTVVRVEGELDAISVATLMPALDEILDRQDSELVLDLSKLRLIDSSGVGAIIYCFRRIRQLGGKLIVRGASQQPLSILRLMKLDHLMASANPP